MSVFSWGNEGADTKINALEDEVAALQIETVEKQAREANNSTTISYYVDAASKNRVIIIKRFNKTALGRDLNKIRNVRTQRYNTSWSDDYFFEFGWYRINSSSSSTGSGGLDQIVCTFEFLTTTTPTNVENWLNENNRQIVYFDFLAN